MLNENGFSRPAKMELVRELSSKWIELFGSNSDVSSHSVAGIIIRMLAFFFDLVYQLSEKVYYSQYLNTASGVSLDRIAANFGINRNTATRSIVDLSFTGTPGYVIPSGSLFKTSDDKVYQLGSSVILNNKGTNQGIAYAVELGSEYNVPANTIVNQLEVTADIFSVTNPEQAEGGSDNETDAELARRVRLANDTKPSSPVNGVISAVMKVPGVKNVQVILNNTMEIDEYDNPAKSIHVYVDGGEEKHISTALFESVAAGILMVGSKEFNITDLSGNPNNHVAFDFAKKQVIYVNVKLSVNSDFELDGEKQVEQAILEYLDTVKMGDSVRYSYLYKYIYDNVKGIVVAEVKIGDSLENLSMADIKLEQFATATSTSESMEITRDGI
ncbi:baseplate J/gp47 family protein [Weissella coleopterorum]|uniref:Baseplate J/gp47 family protein n=1 Tax=Weissella coleopterorum TaxID=2714949 RepID=A0A6G8AYU1_9LACO|nr:baseplate J/gp47 family protein [Weissella coleopterorum]QIL50122.1 baseplate J/gp47 family protein [Weissella coleopterorum]